MLCAVNTTYCHAPRLKTETAYGPHTLGMKQSLCDRENPVASRKKKKKRGGKQGTNVVTFEMKMHLP